MKPLREYAFDVKLFAAIRVKAHSAAEARATLRDNLDCADCNGGAWPDGSPILFEATVDDDEPYLYEIDGEPT
jgi:hypothetical protein